MASYFRAISSEQNELFFLLVYANSKADGPPGFMQKLRKLETESELLW